MILLLLVLISCKKEKKEVPPTIYPLSYLPVYPGSHWVYIDEKGDTAAQYSDSEYKLHQYYSGVINGNLTDWVYVPFWNGTPVYGYSSPQSISPYGPRGLMQIGYLSEQVGDTWEIYHDKYGTQYRKVVAVDTTLSVNSIIYDHVIAVSDYGNLWMNSGNPIVFLRINYYAKNIGLIKQDMIDINTKDTIQHLGIISYFINH